MEKELATLETKVAEKEDEELKKFGLEMMDLLNNLKKVKKECDSFMFSKEIEEKLAQIKDKNASE